MSKVKFFGPRKTFPREGAWVMVGTSLGVIFAIKDDAAEVHLIGTDGQTTSVTSVPKASLTQATHSQVVANVRNAHLTPATSAAMGYTLSPEQIKGLTALERKLLGLSLDDADLAQGLIEESQANLDALKRAKVAKHPDAIALEAQIETERQAFVASVEKRRTELFTKLSATK